MAQSRHRGCSKKGLLVLAMPVATSVRLLALAMPVAGATSERKICCASFLYHVYCGNYNLADAHLGWLWLLHHVGSAPVSSVLLCVHGTRGYQASNIPEANCSSKQGEFLPKVLHLGFFPLPHVQYFHPSEDVVFAPVNFG
jgi:hypothetical protein